MRPSVPPATCACDPKPVSILVDENGLGRWCGRCLAPLNDHARNVNWVTSGPIAQRDLMFPIAMFLLILVTILAVSACVLGSGESGGSPVHLPVPTPGPSDILGR